jgi:hypothetical protein
MIITDTLPSLLRTYLKKLYPSYRIKPLAVPIK